MVVVIQVCMTPIAMIILMILGYIYLLNKIMKLDMDQGFYKPVSNHFFC